MATGQIGFHRQKEVKKIHVEKRINEIINRLNKTKVEKFPDLAAEKAEYEKEVRRKEKAALQETVSHSPKIRIFILILSVYRERKKKELLRRRSKRRKKRNEHTRICMDGKQWRRQRRIKMKIMIQKRISGEDLMYLEGVLLHIYSVALAACIAYTKIPMIPCFLHCHTRYRFLDRSTHALSTSCVLSFHFYITIAINIRRLWR